MKMARYSEEFKQDAINLVKNKGYSVQEVANKLGINRQTLYKWLEGIRLHKKATSMHDLEVENSKLRKQLARAEEEREILKKAAIHSTVHCNNFNKYSFGV